MTQLNRRQWLRTAGLAGAMTMLGGASTLSARPAAAPGRRATDAPTLARLSSNENPYGPSQKVRQTIAEGFDLGCRYPFSYGRELLDLIAQKEGVSTEHVVITAGSTEGLKIAGLIYGMANSEIVAAEPTFRALMDFAEQFGAYIHWAPVDENLQHDLEAMDQRITGRTSLVYVCNPNNPTGTLLPGKQMLDFCETASRRTMVFVDEAYFDFITEPGYPSAIELVHRGANVIVARTFSKVYGLAGLRIGYLIARPDIAERLRNAVVAYTNTLALVAAQAALEDQEFYQFSLRKNEEAKAMIYATLDSLELPYVKSHANFVFFKSGRDIGGLMRDMAAHQVQVGRAFPPMLNWCRVSTGTTEDTQQFCVALRKVMS